MESQPDVQLGKIFIVGCIAMMLFIIILVFVVYLNAKSETANSNAQTTITTKSNESQNGRTPVLFIAFIAITFLAVSTMNLTYKVNYFKNIEKAIKKAERKRIKDSLPTSFESLTFEIPNNELELAIKKKAREE